MLLCKLENARMENRELTITSFLLLILFATVVLAQEPGDIVIGKRCRIHTKILNEDRTYYVYVPEGYDNSRFNTQHFPVMVLLDGETYFHSATGVVRFLAANGKIPKMIVVAIPNTDRTRDLSITTANRGPRGEDFSKIFNSTGGAKLFSRFINEELLPEIDKNYRTTAYRMLVGHSLGGLFATHAFIRNNPSFLSYIVVDPALWWDDFHIIDRIKNDTILQSGAFAKSLYLTSAHNSQTAVDTSPQRHSQEAFFKVLRQKSLPELRADLIVFEEENHGSVFLESLYHGLLYTFPNFEIKGPEVLSAERISTHYNEISILYGSTFLPPEEFVNALGYNYLRDKKNPESALEFFALNRANFPLSADACISISEAYLTLGQKKNAVKNYEDLLKINPKDKRVKSWLKKLNSEH